MVESSNEPSLVDLIKSSASKAHVSYNHFQPSIKPSLALGGEHLRHNDSASKTPQPPGQLPGHPNPSPSSQSDRVADETSSNLPSTAPPPFEAGCGETSSSVEPRVQPNIIVRFYQTSKVILLSSWLNVLLVFVPIGIAVQAAGVKKTIVFAVNAIAIVPLAGLLSYATESVASEMGDTIGALMNITFGNAVELIIFIALTKNEIQIVQASLLGSILANLLLILGMCFLFGGLRFREQIYNSTVTQMSACLLSLSVMSLLLPTAFHASFTDSATADKAVLQISRGTSVILLLVYVLYLLFQMKSHAYMYQSTPQHVIDEESHPGVLAEMLGSSSSSDTSSSSTSSDTDGSSGSNTTAKRIKRVLRGRRRRKSSASSKDTPSLPSTIRTPSASTFTRNAEDHDAPLTESRTDQSALMSPALGAIASGDEADTDGEIEVQPVSKRGTTINFRDFENEKGSHGAKSSGVKSKKKSKTRHHKADKFDEKVRETCEKAGPTSSILREQSNIPCVGFKQDFQVKSEGSPKRPFNIRGLSVRDALPALPPMPKVLSTTVFSTTNSTGPTTGGAPAIGITPRALHRSNSLPSRLNQVQAQRQRTASPMQPEPYANPPNSSHASDNKDATPSKQCISRTSAIFLLLFSTGLVAVCAEFLVSSIDYLVSNTSISEAFVGLIILPIVGNAAEHVTAVTVASKNKMDLAIGVAVGSSIQIALFVTPVIVLLGWILQKDMSLYFSLFETISLFVSAFIVNFLVLDGRSNYLEGALLIAAYVIIALAAFFYPDSDEQSTIGGAEAVHRLLKMF